MTKKIVILVSMASLFIFSGLAYAATDANIDFLTGKIKYFEGKVKTYTDKLVYNEDKLSYYKDKVAYYEERTEFYGKKLQENEANVEQYTNTLNKYIKTQQNPTIEVNQMKEKGMYVWGEGKDIYMTESKHDEFVKTLKAGGFTKVFFNLEGNVYKTPTKVHLLQKLLKKLHENNIKFEYLTGDSLWAKTEYKATAVERCTNLTLINAQTQNQSEKIDAIHFDIEPYTLGTIWKENTSKGSDGYNDELQANYLEIMNDCKTIFKNSGEKTTINVDIPTWYSIDAQDLWTPLTASNSPVDTITIMNYFTTFEEFMYGYGASNKSGGVLPNLASNKQVPMIFAIESKSLSRDTMNDILDKTTNGASENTNFLGTAVHYYKTYLLQ